MVPRSFGRRLRTTLDLRRRRNVQETELRCCFGIRASPQLEREFLLWDAIVGAKATPGRIRIRQTRQRCFERKDHVAVPVRIGTMVGNASRNLNHLSEWPKNEAPDRNHEVPEATAPGCRSRRRSGSTTDRWGRQAPRFV